MAMTDAQICNLALGRVGHRAFIQDLQADTSEAGECCRTVYASCLAELLEASDWGFARRHATLAALTGVTRSGWTYAYALPTDCLVPRRLFNGLRPGVSYPTTSLGIALSDGWPLPASWGGLPQFPFEVETSTDGSQRILLTDSAPAELLYTSSAVSPGAFTQGFIQALAWRVAAEVALSLAVRRDLHQNAAAMAEAKLAKAKAQNLRDRRDDAQPESQFITARN